MAAPLGADSVVAQLVTLVVGAVGGALTTVVAFRVRLRDMDTRMDSHDRDIKDLNAKVDGKLSTIERRQIATLQIISHVARKVGVDERYDDAVVRYLASDIPGAPAV